VNFYTSSFHFLIKHQLTHFCFKILLPSLNCDVRTGLIGTVDDLLYYFTQKIYLLFPFHVRINEHQKQAHYFLLPSIFVIFYYSAERQQQIRSLLV